MKTYLVLTGLFFLSSVPAEANHASGYSVVVSVPSASNRLGLPQRSLPYVPIHIKRRRHSSLGQHRSNIHKLSGQNYPERKIG